jgi:hypothetical protein
MVEESTRYFLATRDGWDFTNNHVRPNGPVFSLPTSDGPGSVNESEEGMWVYTADELPLHLSAVMYELENLGEVTVDEYGSKLHRFVVTKRVHFDEIFVRFYAIQCATMALGYMSEAAHAVGDFRQVPWLMKLEVSGYRSTETIRELRNKAWQYYHHGKPTYVDRHAIGCLAKLMETRDNPWHVASDIVRPLIWIDPANAGITRDLLFRCIRCCG